jgi:hypothetical protein
MALDVKRRGQAGMPLAFHLAGNLHCCREYADLDDIYGGHIATFSATEVPVVLDSLHYETVDNRQTTSATVKGVTILGQIHEFARTTKLTEAALLVAGMKGRKEATCSG